MAIKEVIGDFGELFGNDNALEERHIEFFSVTRGIACPFSEVIAAAFVDCYFRYRVIREYAVSDFLYCFGKNDFAALSVILRKNAVLVDFEFGFFRVVSICGRVVREFVFVNESTVRFDGIGIFALLRVVFDSISGRESCP